MDLTRIIAITGKPGLFELISQTKGGFIVKDLVSQKKLSINANSQVSLLQNISIYTLEAEVPLVSVLINISKKHSYKEINFTKNDSQSLRNMMAEVQPDYAEDKVYNSDLKKLFNWYNILVNNNLITEENILAYEKAISEAEKKEEEKSAEKEVKNEKKEPAKRITSKKKAEK